MVQPLFRTPKSSLYTNLTKFRSITSHKVFSKLRNIQLIKKTVLKASILIDKANKLKVVAPYSVTLY